MFPRRDGDGAAQCSARRSFPVGECRYSIPPRRIETRETYIRHTERRRKRCPTHIEVYSLRYSPPVDFRLRISRPRSLLGHGWQLRPASTPANEAKTGDSRGRSRRVFRKGTLSPPNFEQCRFRKASQALPLSPFPPFSHPLPLEKQFILRSRSER